MIIKQFWLYVIIGLTIISCQKEATLVKSSLDYVQSEKTKLAPVTLTHDISYLPNQEIQVIKLLVKASRIIDRIFLIQVYEKNLDILNTLEQSDCPHSEEYVELFKIMFGPWNRIDDNRPFIGKVKKPDGANYYPMDMGKNEFTAWVKKHPEEKESFESNFTMIRQRDNILTAIPYSEFFKNEIQQVVSYLRQAAELTSDLSLSTYLKSRADGLLNNDYYQSDKDWMDLAGDIEVVIGPYEVYEDNLFGYKAAFESFICVVDHEESKKLEQIANYLIRLEEALPIDETYERGTSSPIKVVNLLYSAGDTKAGIQTSAFNLPNDERVRNEKGSKKVMLKNVMRAKFDQCWIPIVEKALSPETLDDVSFDAYFTHVVMHEVSHGLGPGNIELNGVQTTVNRELKELYPTIEEAKADVLGMYNTQLLIDWDVFPEELEETLYASNLGGMFRSIRFGIDSAHGGGVAIQLNTYLDAGACTVDQEGRFTVDVRKMKTAVKNLARDLLIIQANGDYEAAEALIDQYRIIRPETQAVINRLKDVPIDIRPVYPIENEI
ncbi:peptidase [bacterium]|nr:peptidase [bacterium]